MTIDINQVANLPHGPYVAFVNVDAASWSKVKQQISAVAADWEENSRTHVASFSATRNELLQVARIPGIKSLETVHAQERETIRGKKQRHITGMEPLVQ